jgi:hypothetical protein
MAQDRRMTRRIAGLLNARLPDAQLDSVADPRHARGKRWKRLAVLLRATVTAIIAGCRSTRETEALTDELSRPMRRLLHIGRRLPDTTLRSTLIAIAPAELRRCLYHQLRAAHRRKALSPVALPFGQVAVDGKCTAVDTWDDAYSQRQRHSAGPGAHGNVRTLTAALVSGRATVCLDAAPIPPATNEGGHFPTALRELVHAYGSLDLFRLVSADAGLCSRANAAAVRGHGLHYLFGLKQDNPTLLTEAQRVLAHRRARPVAQTEDTVGPHTVTRRLFLTAELSQYEGWEHLQTVLRVQSLTHQHADGKLLRKEDRYFLSSLPLDALSAEQWLHVVRRHWAVENDCHGVWDKLLREDDQPWIVAGEGACQGTLNVMLLRRIAFNLLALFRNVTQRAEERRLTPWRDLCRWVYNALIAAQPADLAGLRQRAPVATALA